VQELQIIPLTWLFAIWGLDILGPFSRAQGGYRYLYVIINKFTKWVEVDPVCTIPSRSTVKFIHGLVCCFGVPNRIITNNSSQFTSGLFREYCASAGIKICFALVAYPRSNGQAKCANAEVLKGLKTRSFNAKLEACGKKWLDNLQSILWSIQTTATKPTGETPFFLVYGAEAVLPTIVELGSPRVLTFNEIHQEDLIKDRLLQLEEARCQAALRAARYQQGLCRYHSPHVWARTLEVGDLVLRRILSCEGLHKLSPMWEDPFKVTHIAWLDSARLETAEGMSVGNPWNIAHL
jgi:transposase InsO family protein